MFRPVQFCLPVIMLNQCTNSLLSILVESAFLLFALLNIFHIIIIVIIIIIITIIVIVVRVHKFSKNLGATSKF